MDIQTEKIQLIESLLKIQDDILLHRLRVFLEDLIKKKEEENIIPMSLETFYNKIETSEKALSDEDVITQRNLREEVKMWEKYKYQIILS